MTKKQIIKKTREMIEKKFTDESTGHDWWHMYRAWQTAVTIGKKEGADLFVVELGALLHDYADWKFHDCDESASARETRKWLEKLKVDEEIIMHVCDIVQHVSFKGAGAKNKISTLEGKVVQDADRLDALGAMGIARAFAYGGSEKRAMHDPNVKAVKHKNFKQYKSSKGTSINHFYEKLLLLKDLMNTKSGKAMAKKRHVFMVKFLDEFFGEWEGER